MRSRGFGLPRIFAHQYQVIGNLARAGSQPERGEDAGANLAEAKNFGEVFY
jgi:hypothetical protein